MLCPSFLSENANVDLDPISQDPRSTQYPPKTSGNVKQGHLVVITPNVSLMVLACRFCRKGLSKNDVVSKLVIFDPLHPLSFFISTRVFGANPPSPYRGDIVYGGPLKKLFLNFQKECKMAMYCNQQFIYT